MSRAPDDPLTVVCPCGATLQVDRETGEVLGHCEATPPRRADFDSLLAGVDEGRERAERVFQQQLRGLEDRDRLMEEKFRRALERAEADGDQGPPLRPWDLD